MVDPSDFWHILPNYVKKDVVHYLDYKTRCNLSYCSKSDLALVKSTPIAFRNIHFAVVDDALAGIHFNTLNCPGYGRIVVKFDSAEQFADRLAKMLAAPNTCKCFHYCGSNGDDAEQYEMIRLIQKLDAQRIRPKLKVLLWDFTAGDILYEFLTRIDTEYLDGMMMHSTRETEEQVARIVEMEQWKKLKVVDVHGALEPTWRLEHVLDKPKFSINVEEITVDKARRIVETFQAKNHPLGSCFTVQFYSNLNVQELYQDPGQRIVGSEDCAFYLKTFPLADEALELRVQLTAADPDSDTEMEKMSGIVVRKDASLEYVDVSKVIDNCLYDL